MEILDDHSFSNHKYIGFSGESSRPKHKTYRNFRNTNWVLYCRKLRLVHPTAPDRDSILSADAIDELVEVFSSVSRTTLESSCPLKTQKSKGKPPWWTSELTEIRSSSRNSLIKPAKVALVTTGRCRTGHLQVRVEESQEGFVESLLRQCRGLSRVLKV